VFVLIIISGRFGVHTVLDKKLSKLWTEFVIHPTKGLLHVYKEKSIILWKQA